MLQSFRRIRTALVGATLLGLVATTAQAAPPPPIVELGPVNMTSVFYNGEVTRDFNYFLPFTIVNSGDYIFSMKVDSIEKIFGGKGDIYVGIGPSIYNYIFHAPDEMFSKSVTAYLEVGDYVISIATLGDDYKVFGAYASVTPVPGPIAGAGLPLLLGFAGYAAWRRRAAKAAA